MMAAETPSSSNQPPDPTDTPVILFSWPYRDLAEANYAIALMRGIGMIVRVNRTTKNIELFGFEEDEDSND